MPNLRPEQITNNLLDVENEFVELICDAGEYEPLWTFIKDRMNIYPDEPIIYVDQDNHLPVSVRNNKEFKNIIFIGTVHNSVPLFNVFDKFAEEKVGAFVVISSLPSMPRDVTMAVTLSKIKQLVDKGNCTVIIVNDLRINVKTGRELPYFDNVVKRYVDIRADCFNGSYRVINKQKRNSALTAEQAIVAESCSAREGTKWI